MSKLYDQHDFYCINCGEKVFTIPRKVNHKHAKHHRKKLWCPWCGMEVNHVECRNDSEVYEFKRAFEAGEYKEEVQESLNFINKEKNLLWS